MRTPSDEPHHLSLPEEHSRASLVLLSATTLLLHRLHKQVASLRSELDAVRQELRVSLEAEKLATSQLQAAMDDARVSVYLALFYLAAPGDHG